MALRNYRYDDEPTPPALRTQPPGLIEGCAPSPTRVPQQPFAIQAGVLAARDPAQWTLRQRMALIVGTSAALWTTLLWSGAEAIKLLV